MDRPFYSITFGNKNTWDEWALMPVKAGRIEFATPNVKREGVDIPGADGELDMSEVLTGYPTYENRRGALKFRFYNNGVPVRSRWDQLKNYLHGRRMRAIIEDQPEYYYEGRFMVGDLEWAERGNWADTQISYDLNTYKLEMTSASEDWLWDPFNFETGVIREYGNIFVMVGLEPIEMTIIGSRKPTVPKFTVTKDNDHDEYDEVAYIQMEIMDATYQLPYGKTTIFPQIVLFDEEYPITLMNVNQPYGLVLTIDMQGGSL